MRFAKPAFSIVITTMMLCVSYLGYAQEDLPQDPMNNPKVWVKIEQAPNDRSLWVQYFKKPWLSLSVVDKENVKSWSFLLNREIYKHQLNGSDTTARQENFWKEAMANSEISEEMKVKMEIERAQFRKTLLEHLLNESAFMKELKQNITTNFIILEDILKEEFAELNQPYEVYEEVYPNGGISKEEWIKLKTTQLKRFKEVYVQQVDDEKLR